MRKYYEEILQSGIKLFLTATGIHGKELSQEISLRKFNSGNFAYELYRVIRIVANSKMQFL